MTSASSFLLPVALLCSTIIQAQGPPLGVITASPQMVDLGVGQSSLILKNLRFGRIAGYNSAVFVPEVQFAIENRTPVEWSELELRMVVGALCGNSPRQVTATVTAHALASDPEGTYFRREVEPLSGKLNGCSVELLDVGLLRGRSVDGREVDGHLAEVDFSPHLEDVLVAKEKRAKLIEEDRLRRAKESEARRTDSHLKRAAEDRERVLKLRKHCSAIFRRTYQKRISDLTVKESEEIAACRVLDLYPPR